MYSSNTRALYGFLQGCTFFYIFVRFRTQSQVLHSSMERRCRRFGLPGDAKVHDHGQCTLLMFFRLFCDVRDVTILITT